MRDRGSSLFGAKASYATNVSREVQIGSAIAANFNVTTDQAIALTAGYRVTNIRVMNASISLDTAAGGFYSAATKGGTAIVANTQVYTALTDATKTLDCTMAAVLALSTVYFSLTTAQGAAATADIIVYGVT